MKQNEISKLDNTVKRIAAQNIENLFNIYKDSSNMYFYSINRTVNFPDEIDPTYYTEYIATENDSWPLIAHKFYSDVKLWWIVCAVNNIENPVDFPASGKVLKILTPDVVRGVLSKIKEL